MKKKTAQQKEPETELEQDLGGDPELRAQSCQVQASVAHRRLEEQAIARLDSIPWPLLDYFEATVGRQIRELDVLSQVKNVLAFYLRRVEFEIDQELRQK